MKSHELAALLLAGPNVVVTVLDEFGYNKLERVEVKKLKRMPSRSATEVDYYDPQYFVSEEHGSKVVVLI